MTDVPAAPEVLLHEHRTTFSTRHRYEIVVPGGTVAASVEETRGAGGSIFGNVVSSRYLVRAGEDVLLVDADAFSISTDPTLDRDLRAVLLVSVIALDAVRDRQKRSAGD